MANADNFDDQLVIKNFIDHAVISNSYTIAMLRTYEFLYPRWVRILLQFADCLDNFWDHLSRQFCKFFILGSHRA